MDDILRTVPVEEMGSLRDLYKIDWPSHVHIYNFLDTCMGWKRNKKTEDYVSVYCPEGEWADGSFVAVIQVHCYDIIPYSLDKNLSRLKKALTETKVIQWNKRIIFPSVRMEFKDSFASFKKQVTTPFICHVPSYIWWLPKEKALKYEWSIPPEYYLAKLEQSHISTINEVWPHRHPGSENYLSALLGANGGIGLFSKKDDELCCWVLKNYFGGLGLLQTAEKYKKKGLGSMIAKIFSKKLAEEGLDIIGCIVDGNEVSVKLFTGLGFAPKIAVTWLLDVHDDHGSEV